MWLDEGFRLFTSLLSPSCSVTTESDFLLSVNVMVYYDVLSRWE